MKTEFLDEIEALIYKGNKEDKAVSLKGTYWHVDHMLKVINSVCFAIQKSKPETFKSKINLVWQIMKIKGSFPRGKGKAPKAVLPPEIILEEELKSALKMARVNVEEIKKLPKKAYFEHPLFGSLDLKNTQKFLDVHTNHHLKITRDILKR